ncbi:thiamine pyrophosphate-binding protein, partial [Mycobacterium avium]
MSAPTRRPAPDAPGAAGIAPAPPAPAAKPAAGKPKRIGPEQVTGAQSVIRSLEELGVEVIFGIPGGAVLPVYDPLFDSKKLR